MSTPIVETNGDVVVTFPAQSGYLSLCRVNASAVGSMLDFDVDELDELRLAVTEAVNWLLDGADPAGTLSLTLGTSGRSLLFDASCPSLGDGSSELDDLASAIMGATVRDFFTQAEQGVRRCVFSKSIDG